MIVAIRFILFFSVISIIGCSHNLKPNRGICGSDLILDGRDEIKILKIELNLVNDKFFYFYRNDYVVFLNQSDVLGILKDNLKRDNYSQLLKNIIDDGPLKKNVDLRQYSFENTALESISTHIAMTLVESGKAKIIDMRYGNNGQILQNISIVHLDGGGTWRLACDSGYGLIFEVNDSIE